MTNRRVEHRQPLVVDILGPSGSGKSSICETVYSQLEELQLVHSQNSTGTLASKNSQRRRILFHLAKHPDYFFRSFALSKCRPERWSRHRAFWSHLGSLSERSRRREATAEAGSRVVLFPQGLLYRLQTDFAHSLEALPRYLHPDIVVILSAPPHVTAARRIMRSKPMRTLSAEHRIDTAFRTYSILRSGYSASQAARYLELWNSRACTPPIDDDALHRLREDFERRAGEQLARLSAEQAASSVREASRRSALEDWGILVLPVDNGETTSLEETSGKILEAILAQLSKQ